MTELLLEVKELKKYFPIRRHFLPGKVEFVKAVDGVTFQIEQGETHQYNLRPLVRSITYAGRNRIDVRRDGIVGFSRLAIEYPDG